MQLKYAQKSRKVVVCIYKQNKNSILSDQTNSNAKIMNAYYLHPLSPLRLHTRIAELPQLDIGPLRVKPGRYALLSSSSHRLPFVITCQNAIVSWFWTCKQPLTNTVILNWSYS
jgi:hypothetical protein